MTDLLAPSSRPSIESAGLADGSVDLPVAPPTTRVVLDTSVLISDPDSLFAFPDADAVIPLVVDRGARPAQDAAWTTSVGPPGR